MQRFWVFDSRAPAPVLLEESMVRRVSMDYVVAFVGVVFMRGVGSGGAV